MREHFTKVGKSFIVNLEQRIDLHVFRARLDYHCAFLSTILLHGRIYATDRCILFYSKLFGREKKIMLPFSQIKGITPPQGVLRSIIVETGNELFIYFSLFVK